MLRRPLLLVLPLALLACTVAPSSEDDAALSTSGLGTAPEIPELPTYGHAPWGGPDAARWRPEAIVANAASHAMNEAWKRAGVADVVVAIPLQLLSSGFREYGDGQANSRAELGHWRGQSRPPVVATAIHFANAPTKLTLRFDRALPYAGDAFELRYAATTLPLTATRDGRGDAVVEIALPAGLAFDDLLSDQAALVRPAGWGDWFPLHFRMPVKKIADLRASRLRFADGASILDRARVSSVGRADGLTTRERLQAHAFTAPYNGATGRVTPYEPASIHATYPFFGTTIVTGVGRGYTWVADERPQGFKMMYTCFERRRADLEASAPDGGVVSGGGWHQINDAAETILNDLEAAPAMVASGKNNVWLSSQLPGGDFAYGLTDVATFRWLRPGEAFITTKGGSTYDGAGRWYDTANYHWFFFQGDKDVCTEEIVSPDGQVPVGYDL